VETQGAQRRRRRLSAVAAAAGALIAATAALVAANPASAAACESVQYDIVSSWSGAHQANVSLTAGSEGVDGWTIGFNLSGTVQSAWNVTWTQSGTSFTGSDAGWNASVSSGQTRQLFGLIVSGPAAAPTSFTVNGAVCGGDAEETDSPTAPTTPPETTPPPTGEGDTGNATHFSGLGSPYGGCGLPQSELETQDFVALNVYDTPGDYAFYPRPIPPEQADKIGLWDNGCNCGRWVSVSIGDYCTGVNDGAQSQPFCRNGSWTEDEYNGATLNMIVADSCGDANAWCRDDPFHLDLVTSSINRFESGGQPVGDLLDHWNNRQVSWSFVPAPDYSGDIKIGFLQGSQKYWGAVSISQLANGIHGVEFFADGAWHPAEMNGDMGQSYVLEPTAEAGTNFQIRVTDVDDQLINDGRTYSFSLPSTCAPQCSTAYTEVAYTTSG
jgi:hypothetical protein